MYKTQLDGENKMIEEILENFDFTKCHDVMHKLRWTWGLDNRVPDLQKLKDASVQRLRDAISIAKGGSSPHSTYFSWSGGLKATAWKNRYGHIEGLRLEFVLTDWDADGDY